MIRFLLLAITLLPSIATAGALSTLNCGDFSGAATEAHVSDVSASSTVGLNTSYWRRSTIASIQLGATTYRACAYWSAAGDLTIAHWTGDDLTTAKYYTYDGTGGEPDIVCPDLNDVHYTCSLDFDPLGYIHVTGAHHNTALVYYRSNSPIQYWSGVLTGPHQFSGTQATLTSISYVTLFRDRGDHAIYVMFRNGASGDGDQYFQKYNTSTKSWAAAAGTGTNGLFVEGSTATPDQNPYMAMPVFTNNWDGAGTGYCFFSGHWRETASEATNHDLWFFRWDGTNFTTIGGSSQTIPVTPSNDDVVQAIAQSTSMETSTHLAVDANNRPHLCYYYNAGSGPGIYHNYHNGTSWTQTLVTTTSVDNPGEIVVDSSNVAYIVYRATDDSKVKRYASDPNDFTTWTNSTVTATAPTESWRVSYDHYEWMYNGNFLTLIARDTATAPTITSHAATATPFVDIGSKTTAHLKSYGTLTGLSWSKSGTDSASFTLTDNSDGTATLAFTSAATAGTYTVTTTATNGSGSDSTDLTVTVADPSASSDFAGYLSATAAAPSASLTDFTLPISLDSTATSFWSAVTTDGRCLRVFIDGVEQAMDLVEFDYAAQSLLMFVKRSGAQSGAPTVVIYCGNANAVQPLVDDTYGQHNTYTANRFYPSGGRQDRTSTGAHLTLVVAPVETSGPINGSRAIDYDGTASRFTIGSGAPSSLPLSILAHAKADTQTPAATMCVASLGDTGSTHVWALSFRGATAGDPVAAQSLAATSVTVDTSTGYTAGTWHLGSAVFTSATSRSAQIDAGSKVSETTTNSSPSGVDRFSIGNLSRSTQSNHFDGSISMVAVYTSSLSDGWISYWKESLDDPDQSDFYGSWTWTSNAGGNGLLRTIILLSQFDRLHKQQSHFDRYGVYSIAP